MAGDRRPDNWHFDTRSARAGKDTESSRGVPTATPIVPSSGFEQADSAAIDEVYAGGPGYVYGRYHNPTVEALEQTVAALEGAEASLAYASGMGAIAGAFEALRLEAGSRIVAARDLYGSSISYLENGVERRGWVVDYVDADAFTPEVLAGASAAYCETLSNPLVRVFDIDAIGAACAEAGVPLLVDATFTPPNLIRTLEHGTTLAIHSATKYLGGHGDVVAGVLSGSKELIDAARSQRTLDGTIADPFTAWLVLRGIKTLSLRVDRQCDNAADVARFLQGHDAVAGVHYPRVGVRDSAAENELLDRLYPHGRYGAMLAFELASGADAAARFIDALQLFGKAPTLGDLDSLALIPTMTSHRFLDDERRAALGIVPEMIRLSVGVENIEDLTADLDAALTASKG